MDSKKNNDDLGSNEKMNGSRNETKNFVEIPLGDVNKSGIVSSSKKDLSEDTNDVSTIPVERRRSIELEKLEIHPTSDITDIQPKLERISYPKPEVISIPESHIDVMSYIKFSLIVVIILMALLGVALFGVGIYLKVDPDFNNDGIDIHPDMFSHATDISIAVAVILQISGVLGWLGTRRESSLVLTVYFFMALLLVILEITAVALLWHAFSSGKGREEISNYLWKGMDKMRESDFSVTANFNRLQENFQCCGVDSPQDYWKEGIELPRSCVDPAVGGPYYGGCLDKLVENLQKKAKMLGGIAGAIILLQVASVGLSAFICTALWQGKKGVF